jgi:hypothetical protein
MIVCPRLRGSRIVADLGLSGAIYDDWPFEAITHYHIIVANFDDLLGNTALCIFTSWDRLLHLFFLFHRASLQHELLPNLTPEVPPSLDETDLGSPVWVLADSFF